MADRKKQIFGDDQPKQNPWQEDRLGYAPFAKRIADTVISLLAPNGYVIGLHGQWGSGKSTVLQFILAYIKKHNEENKGEEIILVDFRPWIVSGHQDLISSFFKILSETLDAGSGRWRKLGRKIAPIFKKSTDNLVDAAATVAIAAEPSGIASGVGGSLVKIPVNSLINRFLEEPSLQRAYEDLKKKLTESKKRFVVTIDDIDRLEDKEVRAIMQMVKTVGRLPNVIYLLAYDRHIVWNVLDRTVSAYSAPKFAEKIVQHEVELPKPLKSALVKILNDEIAFLVEKTEDSTRWQFIVRDGIYRWISLPRDVVRLSNAVKFSWPALEGEIDPQDLLAIEGLRLFDALTFQWVRNNRDFLFTQGAFVLARDELKDAAIGDLKAQIPTALQPQVLRILSVLFPRSAKSFEGDMAIGVENNSEIIKRRGIGCEDGYDTYFGLQPSSDAIPKVVINDLMLHLNDRSVIETVIRSYLGKINSRGELMSSKILEELRVQFGGREPARATQALLDALFNVGGEIIGDDAKREVFVLSPRAHLEFLIRDILVQWGMEEAGARLVQAFRISNSPALLADIYVERGRELGVFKSDSSQSPVITKQDFENLGEILIAKIWEATITNTLADAPFYFDIIRAWAHLRGLGDVKSWIADGIHSSPEFMAKIAIGLVRYSVGTNERRYTMSSDFDREIYDLNLLISAGERHLRRTDLTDEQRKLLTAIVRGSRQIQTGKAPAYIDEED